MKNSICAEKFTFTSVPGQNETNNYNCQSQECEVELKASKSSKENHSNKFLETMSQVDLLSRLYEQLTASGSVKEFLSIVHNTAEGHLPIHNICVQSF